MTVSKWVKCPFCGADFAVPCMKRATSYGLQLDFFGPPKLVALGHIRPGTKVGCLDKARKLVPGGEPALAGDPDQIRIPCS